MCCLPETDEFRALAQELTFIERAAQHSADLVVESTRKITPQNVPEEMVSHIALNALHFYVCVEDALSRIARVVDHSLPTGEQSHISLLRQMAVELPDVRPPVISEETFYHLDQMRSFRHRLVHAYQERLEWRKMADVTGSIPDCMAALHQDLERFRTFLLAVHAAARPAGRTSRRHRLDPKGR